MATNLTVNLPDEPGQLARLGETLGNAGVNIDGLCACPVGGQAQVHVLVEDAGPARSALEGAGIPVTAEREVVVVECEDKPGALGELARCVADQGINLDLVYLATRTRVVFGAADINALRQALQ